MKLTYSEFVSLYLDDLAKRWYIRRLKKQRTTCIRGMEVCDRLVNNELANKKAYQDREMLIRHELRDMGELECTNITSSTAAA